MTTNFNVKKYSEDNFEFKSRLNPDEIVDRLDKRTLEKESLVMTSTHKDFIGMVYQDSFKVIGSSRRPYGAMCVVDGQIGSTSDIVLTTSLHEGFRLFLIIGVAVVFIFAFYGWIIGQGSLPDFLSKVLAISGGAVGLRFFLHWKYVQARNQTLLDLKRILELT